MNRTNLPARDEEVFQYLLLVRFGIILPYGCDSMNEAGSRHDAVAPTSDIFFRLGITKMCRILR